MTSRPTPAAVACPYNSSACTIHCFAKALNPYFVRWLPFLRSVADAFGFRRQEKGPGDEALLASIPPLSPKCEKINTGK